MHLSNKKSPGTIPLWCWLRNKPLLTNPARRSLPLLFPRLPTSSNNCGVFYYDECLLRSTEMRWMDWLLFLFLRGEWNGLVLNFLIFCFWPMGYGLWAMSYGLWAHDVAYGDRRWVRDEIEMPSTLPAQSLWMLLCHTGYDGNNWSRYRIVCQPVTQLTLIRRLLHISISTKLSINSTKSAVTSRFPQLSRTHFEKIPPYNRTWSWRDCNGAYEASLLRSKHGYEIWNFLWKYGRLAHETIRMA